MQMIKTSSIKTSKILFGCAIAMAVSGNVLALDVNQNEGSGSFEGIYASPFDACLEKSYGAASLTESEAFKVAECFDSLRSSQQGNTGASEHTLIQYATSWYSLAAEKGHKGAKTELDKALLALNSLDGVHVNGESVGGSPNMLASEEKFQSLDLDKNGMLSQMEVAGSADLRHQFPASDLDRDGQLSFGEYTIVAGEATAAGN